MNSLSRTQKPRAGFTLLEVMVVIVILGVLASLVVPNLLGNKEKADRQKAISDIVALENALDMYRLDNGRYPTTEQGLEALIDRKSFYRLVDLGRHAPHQGEDWFGLWSAGSFFPVIPSAALP